MNAAVGKVINSRLGRLPIPIFGSVATFANWARHSSRSLVPAAGWALPGVVGGLWFIWPAVDEEWKISMGLMRDPNEIVKPKVNINERKKTYLIR